MANRYLHITGSTKIADDYDTINETFDMIEDDVVALENKQQTTNQSVKSLQTQLDAAVFSGDSSVAAAQAAVDANGHDYKNLKARLDTEHTQLSEQLADTENKLEVTNDTINQETVSSLMPSGFGVSPVDMTMDIVSSYRNTRLFPTWKVYSRNFKEETLSKRLPRLDAVYLETAFSTPLTLTKTEKGVKFTAAEAARTAVQYLTPSKLMSPNAMFRLKVSDYSVTHRVSIGLTSDRFNFGVAESNQNAHIAQINLKKEGTTTVSTLKPYTADGSPYTLILLIGNNGYNVFVEDNNGVHWVGEITSATMPFMSKAGLARFQPSFGFDLSNSQYVTIESFEVGYFEGFGHADTKIVTYEDGSPVKYNGLYYVSTSARFSGKNGTSGGTCIYSIDTSGNIVEPVSIISSSKGDVIEADTSSKLCYDRNSKQWLYITRAFPSPGGSLHLGKTKQNILDKGVYLIECTQMTGLASNSLDADIIYENDLWTIAYHGGSPRLLQIATSPDLVNWTPKASATTGEGIAIVKASGKKYILTTASNGEIGVYDFNDPTRAIGVIRLTPNPSVTGGGTPWGTFLNMWDGVKNTFYLVVFTGDRYVDDGSNELYSYGDIWIYKARETQNRPEFKHEKNVFLGF